MRFSQIVYISADTDEQFDRAVYQVRAVGGTPIVLHHVIPRPHGMEIPAASRLRLLRSCDVLYAVGSSMEVRRDINDAMDAGLIVVDKAPELLGAWIRHRLAEVV